MIKLYAGDVYEVFLSGDIDASEGVTSDGCIIYADGKRVEYQRASIICYHTGRGSVQSLAFIDGQGQLHHGIAKLPDLAPALNLSILGSLHN